MGLSAEAMASDVTGCRWGILANTLAPEAMATAQARVRQAISDDNPGFFAAKGKLVEFLPLDDKSWQVYAELGGRVVYRITVPADSRIRPEVTSLDGIDETPAEGDDSSPSQGEQGASSCAADLSKLSDKDLASCLSDIAGELESRQK